jgi:hypothetical protein
MSFDKTKSLEELESEKMEKPDFQSSLTLSVYRLWSTPLNLYSTEDLRLMIGQNISLKYLLPIAIDKLTENPFAEGDFHYGDLLCSVLNVESSFWKLHPQMHQAVLETVSGLPSILEEIIESIKKFEKLEV